MLFPAGIALPIKRTESDEVATDTGVAMREVEDFWLDALEIMGVAIRAFDVVAVFDDTRAGVTVGFADVVAVDDEIPN